MKVEGRKSKVESQATDAGHFSVAAGRNEVKAARARAGMLLVALAGMSYGLQAIIGKWAYANGATAITVLALRTMMASLVIWVMVGYARPDIRLPGRKIAELAFLGMVFVASSLCYFVALERIAVGTAVLVVFIFPALVVAGAAVFFKERLSPLKLLALTLALAGCVLTVDPAVALASGAAFDWLGVLFALGSALANAAYALLATRYGRGISGLVAAAYSMPGTAVFYLGWCLVAGGFAWGMTPLGWLLCLSLGIFTGLSWAFYLIGLPYVGPGRASIIITSEPATAVLLGTLLLSEPASLIKLLGGGLIFLAIVLLSVESLKSNVESQ